MVKNKARGGRASRSAGMALVLLMALILLILVLNSMVLTEASGLALQEKLSKIDDSIILENTPSEIKTVEYLENRLDSGNTSEGINSILYLVNKSKLDINKILDEKSNKKLPIKINSYEIYPSGKIELELSKKISNLSSGNITVVLQFSRGLSINEILYLYELGVKPFRSVGYSSVIASIPIDKVSNLQNISYVNWMGEYKPEYKISEEDKKTAIGLKETTKIEAYIWPLPKNDESKFRQDLSGAGLENLGYDKVANVYYATMEPSFIYAVADFYWVDKIEFIKPIGLHAIPELSFEPDDSRELINAPIVWNYYDGTNVKIGVLDTGIDSTHPDFANAIAWQYNQTSYVFG